MPVPTGIRRFCGVDQRVVELNAEGRCPLCNTQYLNFLEDTGVQMPHNPPSVRGTVVTEEVDAMTPEAGQPEGEKAVEPQADAPAGAEQAQPVQPDDKAAVDAAQSGAETLPPQQGAPDPAPGASDLQSVGAKQEFPPISSDRPAEASSAAVEQPNETTVGGSDVVQPAPSAATSYALVYGSLTGSLAGPFDSLEAAQAAQNAALQNNPGQSATVVTLNPPAN